MSQSERFFKALGKGDEATVLALLDSEPGLAGQSGSARSPAFNKQAPALVMAAELGFSAVVSALLKAGADIRSRGALGGMALHWAAWQGHASIVRHLIEAGAPIEARDSQFDCTPLFWAVHGFSYHGDAVRRNQLGAAELLLQAGANPQVRNHDGTLAADLLADPADAPMLALINPSPFR